MHHATAAIPTAWERAIAYGDGFFETVLVIDGSAALWSFHRKRLDETAKRLNIRCDILSIEHDFFSCAQQHQHAVIKITVARTGGQRGYRAQTPSDVVVNIHAYPIPAFPQQRLTEGVRLHVCRQRLAHNSVLAGIKHLNRLEQVLAASERNDQVADEGLMLDQTGSVIEGVSSNIFILKGKKLCTPLLNNCGVAGVMRAAIIQHFSESTDLHIIETRITLQDCLSADGMFICNSIIGIVPVQSIGVCRLPVHAEISTRLLKMTSSLGYARLYA